MVRLPLPDIPVDAWTGYLQDQFNEGADALSKAMDFRMSSLPFLESMAADPMQNPLYDEYERTLQQNADAVNQQREEERRRLEEEQQRLQLEAQLTQQQAGAQHEQYQQHLLDGGNPGEPVPLTPYPDVAPDPSMGYPIDRGPGSVDAEGAVTSEGLTQPLYRGTPDPQLNQAGDVRAMGTGFGKPYDPAEIESSRQSFVQATAPQEGQSFADYSEGLMGQMEPFVPQEDPNPADPSTNPGEPDPIALGPSEADIQADPTAGMAPHEKAMMVMANQLSNLGNTVKTILTGGTEDSNAGIVPGVNDQAVGTAGPTDVTAQANTAIQAQGQRQRDLSAYNKENVQEPPGWAGAKAEIANEADKRDISGALQRYNDDPNPANAAFLAGAVAGTLPTIVPAVGEGMMEDIHPALKRPFPNPLGMEQAENVKLRDVVGNALPGVTSLAARAIPEDISMRDVGSTLGVEEGAKFGAGDVLGNFAPTKPIDALQYAGIIGALLQNPNDPVARGMAAPLAIAAARAGVRGVAGTQAARAAERDFGGVAQPSVGIMDTAERAVAESPEDIALREASGVQPPDVPITHPSRGGLAVGEEFVEGTPEAHVAETLRQSALKSPDGMAHLTAEEVQALPGMPVVDAPAPTQAVDKAGNPRFTNKGEPVMTVDMRGRTPSLDDLRDAVDVGMPHSLWYNDFGRWIKDTVGEANINEFRTLFGITSARTKVLPNFINTVASMRWARELDAAGKLTDRNAWEEKIRSSRWPTPEMKKGVPTGNTQMNKFQIPGQMIDKIVTGYRDGVIPNPTAAKTPSYSGNVLSGAFNKYDPNTTQDVWQFQLLGWVNSFAPQQSDESYRATHALFDYLAREKGINPNQAQAAAWFSIKQMTDLAPSLRRKVDTGELTLGQALRQANDKGLYRAEAADANVAGALAHPGAQHWLQQAQEVIDPNTPGPGRASEMALVYPGDSRVKPPYTPRSVSPEQTEAARTRATELGPRVTVPGVIDGLEDGQGIAGLEHVPHIAETFGDTTHVVLPGGNAQTALYTAATVGKQTGAEAVRIHIPASSAATDGGIRVAAPNSIKLDPAKIDSAVTALRENGHEVFVDPKRQGLRILLPEGADRAQKQSTVIAARTAAEQLGLGADAIRGFKGDFHTVNATDYDRLAGELGGTYGSTRRSGLSERPSGGGAAEASLTVRSARPDEFIALRNRNARAAFMSPLTPDKLQGSKPVVLGSERTGFAGYALTPDGDIQNVFNVAGRDGGKTPGLGARAVLDAIENGGRTLDAYDGYLPDYYHQFGFEEVGRVPFNRDYAPPNWDYAKYGEPDVVLMARRDYHPGDTPDAIVERITGSRDSWHKPATAERFPDWDAAEAAREQFFARANEGRGRVAGVDGEGQGAGVRSPTPTADLGSGPSSGRAGLTVGGVGEGTSIAAAPVNSLVGDTRRATDRYYHGTGSDFPRPEAGNFDPNGLYGPGYYLSDDPRVPGSYAEMRSNLDVTAADVARFKTALQRSSLDPALRQQYERAIQQFDAPTSGPNIRPVDVPRDLQLLDMDAKVPAGLVDQIRSVLSDMPRGMAKEFEDQLTISRPDPNMPQRWRGVINPDATVQHVYDAIPADNAWKNQLFQRELGYDGIRYAGGKRIPLTDEAGKAIEHQAVVIFPESLDKITNATAGTPGGLLPGVGALKPGSYVQSTVAGAAAGGVGAAREENATPESIARGAALGAAQGIAGRALNRGNLDPWVSRAARKAKWEMPWEPLYGDRPKGPAAPDEPGLLRTIANKVEDFRAGVSHALFDNRTYMNKLQEMAERPVAQGGLGRKLTYEENMSYLTRRNTNMVAKVSIDEGLRPAIQKVGEDIDYFRDVTTYLDNIAVANATAGKVYESGLSRGLAAERRVRVLERKIGNGSATQADVRALHTARQDLAHDTAVREGESYQDATMAAEGRKFSGDVDLRESEQRLQQIRDTIGEDRWKNLMDASDDIQEWVDGYRQKMHDAGMIDAETLKGLREYSYYLPTRIVDYIKDEASVTTGGRISLRDRGIHENSIAGTIRAREDPLQSLIRMAYDVEGRISRNEAFNAFHRLHEELPEMFPAERWAQGKTVPADDVGFRSPVIAGYVDGEKIAYKLATPQLAEALRVRTDPWVANITNSVIGKGATFLREAITRHPAFIAAQIPLDAFAAAVRETGMEGNLGRAPAVVLELARAYTDVWGGLKGGEFKGDLARMLKEGSGMAGYQDTTAKGLRTSVEDLQRTSMFNGFDARNPEDIGRVLKWIATMEPYQAVGQRLEMAPRLAAFRLAEKRRLRDIRQGKVAPDQLIYDPNTRQYKPGADYDRTTGLVAAMEARDVTIDFQRGGWAAKLANSFIPFFNVGFQGVAQIPRMFRANPVGTTMALTAAVGLPTVMAEMYNRSTPEMAQDYEDIPNYVKQRNFIIMAPILDGEGKNGERRPGYISIPVRELAPVMIASRLAARGVIEQTGGNVNDNATWQSAFWDMANTTSPISGSSPGDLGQSFIPYGLSTYTQLTNNRDTFRNRDIATERNDQDASPIAKALAETAYKMGLDWRPSQLEFAIRDLTGHSGAGVLAIPNAAAELTGQKEREETGAGGLPVVGGLAKRFVGGSGGERLSQARQTQISGDTRDVLHEYGMRPDSITPVPGKLQNIALTREEQTQWQSDFNTAFEDELSKLQRTSEWRSAKTDAEHEELIRKAANAARSRTGQKILDKIPSTARRERERRGVAA